MRNKIKIPNPSIQQLLRLERAYAPFVLLNSNNSEQLQSDPYGEYDFLVAVGAIETLEKDENVFSLLKEHHDKNQDWIFGFMTYDVKNQVEKLTSENPDGIGVPLYSFFRPRYVITIKDGKTEIHYESSLDNENTLKQLTALLTGESSLAFRNEMKEITARTSREKYISTFQKIKKHIQRGDIYEMNYCIEFYNEDAVIDPASVYLKLNELSPMPFSAFMHSGEEYILCASPERYLAKRKNKIISQPIKGTAKRGSDPSADEAIKYRLAIDPKEQSENVMIVDMVRNDLSRTAARGSVKVEELFGIKTFKQLHQMVTTVVSEIKEDVHFTEVIEKSFPMGSMTGAPKVSAMKLIEEYEEVKRGLFSGSIGYIRPDGDFDFNVIIRSIIYNEKNKYLSYMAGSAITIAANPDQEYDECLLKASAMKQVLTNEYQSVTHSE